VPGGFGICEKENNGGGRAKTSAKICFEKEEDELFRKTVKGFLGG